MFAFGFFSLLRTRTNFYFYHKMSESPVGNASITPTPQAGSQSQSLPFIPGRLTHQIMHKFYQLQEELYPNNFQILMAHQMT
jgi:hypothetical protein